MIIGPSVGIRISYSKRHTYGKLMTVKLIYKSFRRKNDIVSLVVCENRRTEIIG